jgi:hypothetical protein
MVKATNPWKRDDFGVDGLRDGLPHRRRVLGESEVRAIVVVAGDELRLQASYAYLRHRRPVAVEDRSAPRSDFVGRDLARSLEDSEGVHDAGELVRFENLGSRGGGIQTPKTRLQLGRVDLAGC